MPHPSSTVHPHSGNMTQVTRRLIREAAGLEAPGTNEPRVHWARQRCPAAQAAQQEPPQCHEVVCFMLRRSATLTKQVLRRFPQAASIPETKSGRLRVAHELNAGACGRTPGDRHLATCGRPQWEI